MSPAARGQVIGLLSRHGVAENSRVATSVEAAAFADRYDTVQLDWPGVIGGAPKDFGLVDAIVLPTEGIERAPDPDAALQVLTSLLSPGGALVFVTPNAFFARTIINLKRRGAQVDRNLGSMLNPPSRKVVYSVSGLRALMERNGMTTKRILPAAPTLATRGIVPVLVYLTSRLVQSVLPPVVLSPSMICIGLRKD